MKPLLTTTNNYNPIVKKNMLVTGSGHVCVITGWTPKERLLKYLQPEDYACIGNLYSPRGIDYIVRNLLANPQIRTVAGIDGSIEDSNSGSMVALESFFNKEDSQYISTDIPQSDIDFIRNNIKYYRFLTLKDLIANFDIVKRNPITIQNKEPVKYYVDLKANTDTLPSPLSGRVFRGKRVADIWPNIVKYIYTHGQEIPTQYGGMTKEVLNLCCVIEEEPYPFYFPKPNYLPVSHRFVSEYIAEIVQDKDENNTSDYTYGERIFSWFNRNQVQDAITLINNSKDTRRAVINLWDSTKDIDSSNPPCLNHIGLRILDNKLCMNVVFRSHDIYSAWPPNIMGLRKLQIDIYDHIEYEDIVLGPLTVLSESAHIYDDCYDAVEKLINNFPRQTNSYTDSVGNFVISVTDQIYIEQQYDDGKLYIYSGKNPLTLIKKLAENNPDIDSYHMGYLGIEIQKAYFALNSSLPYVQT